MSVTIEELISGPIKRITFTWTSETDGTGATTTLNSYAGTVTAAMFTPGSGADQPTDLYDVTLKTAGNVDVLNGNGANLSNAADVNLTAAQIAALSSFTSSLLTLAISNSGSANTGVITVYIYGTTNEYCTLNQVKNRLNQESVSTSTIDDSVITDMIEQASRIMDTLCGGRWFYKYSATRYYDLPEDRQLDLGEELISVTTLTNGDATVITTSDYILIDRNNPPYYAIRLKETSSVVWQLDSSGNSEQVITLAGYWGYVDRTATDPKSMAVIKATEDICIAIVMNAYKKRYGENATGTATITAAGVVITPDDVPALERRALAGLMRQH